MDAQLVAILVNDLTQVRIGYDLRCSCLHVAVSSRTGAA